MKIEKLTENKIRIVVNLEELENNNLNLNDFVENNVESQKFFLDILNRAEKEVGFYTKNCKLLIETYSSLDEVFVFTITKFSGFKHNKKNIKLKNSKNIAVLRNPIYRFSSFDEFCEVCEVLQKSGVSFNGIAKKISLYLYNGTYYIAFFDLNLACRDLKKLLSILSEYASVVGRHLNFDAKLFEYGKPIIKQNAFKTGVKYFA